MSFIPTPNAVRTAIEGLVNSNQQVITLWFLGAAPAAPGDLTLLDTALAAWVTGTLLPLLSNGYGTVDIYSIAQDSTTAPSEIFTTGFPATGAVNSPVIEPQTAPVVKFATGARGRSGRGRNYVPGCPLNALSAPGVIGATFFNALIAAYGGLPGALAGTGYQHVVVQHFSNNVALAVGVPRIVTDYQITNTSVGTQRRRRIGAGS